MCDVTADGFYTNCAVNSKFDSPCQSGTASFYTYNNYAYHGCRNPGYGTPGVFQCLFDISFSPTRAPTERPTTETPTSFPTVFVTRAPTAEPTLSPTSPPREEVALGPPTNLGLAVGIPAGLVLVFLCCFWVQRANKELTVDKAATTTKGGSVTQLPESCQMSQLSMSNPAVSVQALSKVPTEEKSRAQELWSASQCFSANHISVEQFSWLTTTPKDRSYPVLLALDGLRRAGRLTHDQVDAIFAAFGGPVHNPSMQSPVHTTPAQSPYAPTERDRLPSYHAPLNSGGFDPSAPPAYEEEEFAPSAPTKFRVSRSK